MTAPLSDATRIAQALAAEAPAMRALLAEIVDIDSNSQDKAGVDRVGEVLAEWLAARGVSCRRIALPAHGDAFLAEIPGTPAGGNAPVLLMGHRDTVFPTGEAARRPYAEAGNRAFGPGVADMKGGLVMNAAVAAVLAGSGVAHPPIRLLMTGDEEIATPASRAVIRAAAEGARAVFNAEPGRVSGNVVVARRGGIFFRVTVTGRAAHAGLNFTEGRSAILALARKIEAWMAMTSPARDVTVNVGLISGGQSVNTVAPSAEAQIDLRYGDAALRDRLVAEVTAIALAADVEGTSASLEVLGEFEPMIESPAQAALLATYVAQAAAAGLVLTGERTASCADSGITAAMGVPTLCATGPVGGGAHGPDEYLELDTLGPRALALALTLNAMAA